MSRSKAKPLSELGTLGQKVTVLEAAETELRRMEEALRKNEEKARFFVENAGETIAVLDADGRFRTMNSDH